MDLVTAGRRALARPSTNEKNTPAGKPPLRLQALNSTPRSASQEATLTEASQRRNTRALYFPIITCQSQQELNSRRILSRLPLIIGNLRIRERPM